MPTITKRTKSPTRCYCGTDKSYHVKACPYCWDQLAAAVRALLEVGGLMSNICYNWGQESWDVNMDAHARSQLRQLQGRWDGAATTVRERLPGMERK